MYLLGLEFACFSNGQMWKVFKWWVGPPAAAGPSSLPGEQSLPEGREVAQHQDWPMQRGPQGLEASCSCQWKVLAGGFLLDPHPSHESPPASLFHLPCPPSLARADQSVQCYLADLLLLIFNICFPILWKIENLSTISPSPASSPASPWLLTSSHLFLTGIM